MPNCRRCLKDIPHEGWCEECFSVVHPDPEHRPSQIAQGTPPPFTLSGSYQPVVQGLVSPAPAPETLWAKVKSVMKHKVW